jgi:hypothetical protein
VTINRSSLISCFIAVIFFACSKSSHWSSDRISSEEKESCSSRLSYTSKDRIHGVDVEFLKIGDRLNVYLHIHSIPVPPQEGNPNTAPVKIKTGEGIFSFSAYRFEGGQRFLLSEQASHLLISALQNQKEATLILPGYRSTIQPEDFSRKFHQLQHALPFTNPFHSPL